MGTTHYIKDYVHHIHASDFTTVRVGSQTDGWSDMQAVAAILDVSLDEAVALASYLPVGPVFGTPEWEANLVRMLEVTARVPDTWVQLIPTFTWKQRDQGTPEANIDMFNSMFDRVHGVVMAGGYQHVFYEAFNEIVHPLSQHFKDEHVREVLIHINEATQIPVGTDYHGGRADDVWKGRYPYIWRDVVDYIAFHTPRNPEPSLAEMQAAQDKYKYNKPVLIDETVAWASQANIEKWDLEGKGTIAQNGYGTEASRMAQVVAHLRDISHVTNRNGLPWVPTYHSVWGIICNEISKVPPYE
jgi:hypothetical protein